MTLKIQEYLRGGGSFERLLSEYAIRAKRDPTHDNLVLFKYDQVSSPFDKPIVRECRGIILDERDDWHVVSRAFDKFFNYGEALAADVDWQTAKVQEKVDGSLCVLYPYEGEWRVATSGTPDGSGDVNGFGISFADLFWKVMAGRSAHLRPEVCFYAFFFELTAPENRVVVRQSGEKLTLLGGRSLASGDELTLSEARTFFPDVDPVRQYALASFAEIAETFKIMDPLEQEGYVVVDATFRRVKVKHPGYVALHHVKGGASLRALVEVARSGEGDELVSAFPDLKVRVDDARLRLLALTNEVASDYERLRDIEQQKAFALEAKETRCPGALFAVRARKVESVAAFFRQMRVDSLMQLLGYKGAEIAAEAPLLTAD